MLRIIGDDNHRNEGMPSTVWESCIKHKFGFTSLLHFCLVVAYLTSFPPTRYSPYSCVLWLYHFDTLWLYHSYTLPPLIHACIPDDCLDIEFQFRILLSL